MSDTVPNTAPADPLAATLARWRATVEAELKGAAFDKKFVTRTPEGIALQPVYTRLDLAGIPHLDAAPGVAPFVRGVRPLGYKAKAWEVAQEIVATSAVDFQNAIREDLMQGQNAVVLTPDAATRAGLDADQAPADQVGQGGVPLMDTTEIAAALKDVELTAVPVHLAAGADPVPVAALFVEHAQSRGTDTKKLTGAVTGDPLGEWVARGELPAGLPALYDALAVWTKWAKEHAPALQTIGVDAAVYGDAGATAVQELAFAIAAAAEYFRALDERGVPASAAAARMNFRFAVGAQFFTEVAKFRAFHPLFARVASAFGAKPSYIAKATVHAATGRWNKTLLDPHVNLLRATTEALSAVLGGCDSLHVAPFDAVAGTSSDFSRRIARNVHTLLAEEFSFAEAADPAGGSWYIEKLTDSLARNAWTLFQDIEARGGLAATLKAGYPQQLVTKAAGEKQDGVAKRRSGLVGTNLFPNLKEKPLVAATVDAASRQAQVAARVQSRRGPAPAAVPGNRFVTAVAAAHAGATVGQLARLRPAGAAVEQAIAPLAARRASEPFEALRAATAAFATRTGARPKVFLAKMGPTIQHKPRADFSAGFFAVAGFEPIAKQAFETAESAAQAAIASGAKVVVLCSTDDTYPTLVPAFASAVKAANAGITVVLAGLPADPAVVASFRSAGVDEFIHIRANVYELLAKLLKQIGVIA
jgi:methylmalonyl-CoA mutase